MVAYFRSCCLYLKWNMTCQVLERVISRTPSERVSCARLCGVQLLYAALQQHSPREFPLAPILVAVIKLLNDQVSQQHR